MHTVLRCVAGLTGSVLGIWACYGGYDIIARNYLRSGLDPGLNIGREIEVWALIATLLLGAVFSWMYALGSSVWKSRP